METPEKHEWNHKNQGSCLALKSSSWVVQLDASFDRGINLFSLCDVSGHDWNVQIPWKQKKQVWKEALEKH